MAAYREGMKTVLIPKDNVSDLYEVDDEVKKNLEFLPMSNLSQVLNAALLKPESGGYPPPYQEGRKGCRCRRHVPDCRKAQDRCRLLRGKGSFYELQQSGFYGQLWYFQPAARQ